MTSSPDATAPYDRHVDVAALGQVAAAVAVLGFSYLALKEYDQGQCLYINWGAGNAVGDPRQFWFQTGAGMLFLVAFVWLGAAIGVLIRTWLVRDGSTRRAATMGAAFALAIYALVGAATWHADPTFHNGDLRSERYLSVLWPIGLLQRSGNFGVTLCGE